MAQFVHITEARAARRIERSGIAARSHGRAGGRGVYCMPVLPSFTLTHQWVRELRRWHPGMLVAVHLRLPDEEPVTVARYGAPPREVTAAQAVAVVRELDDPRAYEVARLRRRFPYDQPPRPKSELMARLETAATADEIIDVLCELGRGRRGGAEELAYLADHPDPDVRDTLESVLRVYRGREARRLRERLRSSDSSASGLDNR